MIRSVLILCLVALAIGTLYFFQMRPEPQLVRQVRAGQGAIESSIRATGVAMPQRETRLAADVSGTVIDAPHRVGDAVRAGDVLLRLDDTEMQAELRSRVRAAEEVATEMDLQRRRLNDMRADLRVGAATRSELRDAEMGLRRVQARHARMLADLDGVRVRLKKTVLVAPYDATVTERHVEMGEQAQPGRPLYTLATTDALEVLVKLDPAEAANVRVGTPVRLALEGRHDAPMNEQVLRIEPSVKKEGNADHLPVWVSVSLPSSVSGIRARQQVDVDFLTDAHQAAVRLPLEALVTVDGRDSVWVVQAGRAHRVPVVLGRMGDRHVEVREGIVAGQVVALPEGRTLAEGDALKVLETPLP